MERTVWSLRGCCGEPLTISDVHRNRPLPIILPRTRSFVVVRMLQRGVLIWGSDSCTGETSGCCGLVRRFVASSCTWNWPKPDLDCGVTLGALEMVIEGLKCKNTTVFTYLFCDTECSVWGCSEARECGMHFLGCLYSWHHPKRLVATKFWVWDFR